MPQILSYLLEVQEAGQVHQLLALVLIVYLKTPFRLYKKLERENGRERERREEGKKERRTYQKKIYVHVYI
jgi:hypothetical protein